MPALHVVREKRSRKVLSTKDWREQFARVEVDARLAEALIDHDMELRRRNELLEQIVDTLLFRSTADALTLAHARRLARAYRLHGGAP